MELHYAIYAQKMGDRNKLILSIYFVQVENLQIKAG